MASSGDSSATRGGPGAVSAVVVYYQGERHLPACLDALLAQDAPLDEVLVVDNGSTDASLGLLAERYPSVRVVELGENAGPARARNVGMREARNRWVLAVDNDAVLAPDVLSRLLAAAALHPEAAILQPRSVFDHEPGRVHYDGGAPHFAGLIRLRNFYVPIERAEGQGVVPVDVAVSVCLLVDSLALLDLGGYDPSFFILFEDLDLSYRLRLAGWSILSVEDAIVRHRAGTPGVSFREGRHYPARRVYYHARNRWLFLLKCLRWRTLLVSSPALLLYEAAGFAFALRHGALLAWASGKLAVLRGAAALAERRAAVQSTRVLADRELLVGGPLTLTPDVAKSARAARLGGLLDAALCRWWSWVSRHAG